MEKHRLGFWAIIVLVIMNLGLLGLLWSDHLRMPPRMPDGNKADSEAFIIRDLQLDQQQADSVRVLREVYFHEVDSLQIDIFRYGRQIVEELFKKSPDTVMVRQLSDSIGLKQADYEMKLYEHLEQIKQLCRPEQDERFRQLVFDIIRLKQPPPPRGNHMPPPPGDHPPPPGGAPPPGSEDRPQPPN